MIRSEFLSSLKVDWWWSRKKRCLSMAKAGGMCRKGEKGGKKRKNC